MKIRHKVLFFLFLLSIITFLDRVCMNVVSKYVKEDLDLDNQSFGYILGAFSLAYALFELPTGILGDRIGPRKVLTRVVLWWSGFTALTGTAFGFVYLLIVRFLFGMGEAGAYPNASIAIARWFPAVEVGRAQSVIWAAGRIGGALTPLLVIPLVHLVGWRMAFFILGVVGSIWAAAWYYWFRDNPSEHKGITQKEIEEIETARKNAPISHKIHWKTIIKNPNIWLLMIMCHLFFYASYFFTNWSSTYFQEGRMMTEDQTKNFISLSYFLGAIGCIVGGFASDFLSKKFGLKLGRRIVGVAGLGLSSICFLGAGLTTDNQLAGYLLALCVFLKDLTLPVAFAVCVDIGKRNAGTVTGAMNFAGQMGGFFITIIFGTIVQQTGNFNYPLFLIAGCLIVASALWFFIDPTKEIVEG
ncbi:MFS transporter [Lacihabitans sp. CS3-21]|uniref:MFS transporter n=1 Tax=Lacihabitans sp. CS3-21 TaxID=2487332 RepID=UPI0020CBFB2D|nr:MFS transporter [Lacihabitans sp. CS3-21]MCP9745443.1 MFS transporter [Lacihabitans sp. CS3-21]